MEVGYCRHVLRLAGRTAASSFGLLPQQIREQTHRDLRGILGNLREEKLRRHGGVDGRSACPPPL